MPVGSRFEIEATDLLLEHAGVNSTAAQQFGVDARFDDSAWSSTTIRSAFIALRKRCAMSRTVRPSIRRSIAS